MAGLSLIKKAGLTAFGLASGGAAVVYTLDEAVKAELHLHPPKMPWSHHGVLNSFDAASIRRGYQVYRNVCSACHSMKFLKFRHLVDVAHTRDEMVEIAGEYQVLDGPNAEGEMYERPGKVPDPFPKPYPNTVAAAAANNGAAPPDLSYIALARHGGEDYIYHLLTSYCEAPAGIKLMDGQNFNPYMNGGAIAMAAPLYSEIIEYDDGTPATLSQLTKDVCTFLAWSASPEQDQRKRTGIKGMLLIGGFLLPLCWYKNRQTWAVLKQQKFVFTPKNYKK